MCGKETTIPLSLHILHTCTAMPNRRDVTIVTCLCGFREWASASSTNPVLGSSSYTRWQRHFADDRTVEEHLLRVISGREVAS
jgi:hypothetical protein